MGPTDRIKDAAALARSNLRDRPIESFVAWSAGKVGGRTINVDGRQYRKKSSSRLASTRTQTRNSSPDQSPRLETDSNAWTWSSRLQRTVSLHQQTRRRVVMD
jgi:hypothetical protein